MKNRTLSPDRVTGLLGNIDIPDQGRDIITFLNQERKSFQTVISNSQFLDASRHLVAWLRGYMKLGGIGLLGLGLSGGIDSALVALLAFMAAGREGLVTFNVPVQNLQEDSRHAECFAKAVGFLNVFEDATVVYDFLASRLLISTSEPANFLALNLKSELRQFLMHWQLRVFAHKRDILGVLLGTGNWSEDGFIYYYTKFGDGRRDIDVITALSKSQVRTMFKVLCTYLEIPKEAWQPIYDKPPSGGLVIESDGRYQTDDDELPGTYDQRDRIQRLLETLNYDSDRVLAVLEPEEKLVFVGMLRWYLKGWHKSYIPAPDRRFNLLFTREEVEAIVHKVEASQE